MRSLPIDPCHGRIGSPRVGGGVRLDRGAWVCLFGIFLGDFTSHDSIWRKEPFSHENSRLSAQSLSGYPHSVRGPKVGRRRFLSCRPACPHFSSSATAAALIDETRSGSVLKIPSLWEAVGLQPGLRGRPSAGGAKPRTAAAKTAP
jgi:hypothetical protein